MVKKNTTTPNTTTPNTGVPTFTLGGTGGPSLGPAPILGTLGITRITATDSKNYMKQLYAQLLKKAMQENKGATEKQASAIANENLIQIAQAISGDTSINNVGSTKSSNGAFYVLQTMLNKIPSYSPGGVYENNVTYDPATGTAKVKAQIVPPNTPGTGNGAGQAGVTSMSATAQANAYNTIYNDLDMWGLTSLAGEAYNKITALGDNMDMKGIINWIRTTPEYETRFPGNTIVDPKTKQTSTKLSENAYDTLVTAYRGAAQQYGLPPAALDAKHIANLIQGNVSAGEFASRLQYGYDLAKNADPNVKAALAQMGITQSNLTHYFVDPKNAYDTINKQMTAAEIMGTGVDTGFGAIDKNTAQMIASQYAGSSTTLDKTAITSALKSALPMVGLEQEQVGQRGQATVSQGQLLSQAFPGMHSTTGTSAAGDAASIRMAQEARVAGLSGGGGYATSAKGAVGIGRAGSTGVGSA
jgi:hypothetical protein